MAQDISTDVAVTHESDEEQDVKRDLKDRLYLPLLIPVASAAIVALLAVSFSRIFLAGSKRAEPGVVETVTDHASKSTAPVMWATIITLFVLGAAAVISTMKSMRKTTFTLLVSGGIILTIVAGSVLAGSSDVAKTAVEFGKPTEAEIATADPANKVEIDALGTNEFQANNFTANAGVVNITYVGKGGSHRLKFANDIRFSWFDLAANPGSTESQPVTLQPGEYTVFCPISGHTKMVAKLVVK